MKAVLALACWFLLAAGQMFAEEALQPAPAAAPEAAETAAGSYTVVKGDTLQKIAARVYKDSSQWTKLWEANKQSLPNPNILQINQVLTVPHLSAPAAQAAAQSTPEHIQPSSPQEPAVTADTEPAPVATGNKDITTVAAAPVEENNSTDAAISEETPAVVSSADPEPVSTPAATAVEKPRAAVPMRYKGDGFIAPKDWAGDGIILGDKDKKMMISDGDTVFVNLGAEQVVPGTAATIYRKLKKVKNPDTGAAMGVEVRLVGTLEITTTIGTDSSTAKIIYAREPIAIGDIVCINN